MALMEWSDKLSVGVKELDEQHKKLIGMINDLHDAMKTGKAKDVTGNILAGLIDYVSTHFANEERLFRTHAYPDYMQHKAEHDRLTQKVIESKRQFDAGTLMINIDLMNFLKDWLQNHILGTDKKYGPYLNSKGIN